MHDFSLTTNPYALPPLWIGLVILLLGVAVLIRDRFSTVSIAFFLVTASASIWLTGYGVTYSTQHEAIATRWIKALHLGVVFIPTFVYLFVLAIIRQVRHHRRMIWFSLSLSCFLYLAVLGTDTFILGVRRYSWGFYPEYGWLSAPYVVLLITLVSRSLRLLWIDYQRSLEAPHRYRVRAFLVALPVASLASVDLAAAYGIALYPFGYLPIFLFTLISARAIWRYRLLDLTPAFAAGHILETMPGITMVVDAEGAIRIVNRAACLLLGYREGDLIGRNLSDLLGPSTEPMIQPGHMLQYGHLRNHEIYLKANGEELVAVSASASAIRDEMGEPVGVVYVAMDLTGHKETEAALRESKRALSSLMSNLPGMAYRCRNDRERTMEYVSEGCLELTGYRQEDLLSNKTISYTNIVHPEDQDWLWEKCQNALRLKTPCKNEYRIITAKNTEKWVWEQAHGIYSDSGELLSIEGFITDISHRKQAEEQLKYLVHHDPLTDLPNRVLLVDRLGQVLKHASREGRGVAVLFVDLDHFKVINDGLGHTMGDLLLKAVAKRLKSSVREVDTVARLGGDEFILVLTDIAQSQAVPQIIQKILQTLANPFIVEEHEFFLTASIGVSLYPTDGQEGQLLMKQADSAMHRAKEQGRNTYQFFSPEMNARASERLALAGKLHKALEREEFLLHYQPIIDLGTGRIVGMEALVRWQSPEKGLVPPGRFIPLAEETGVILPLFDWILRTACRQRKAWLDAGLPSFRVAVNLSARQFYQTSLTEVVTRTLNEVGLDPCYLELELTESLLMQKAESITQTLKELNAMGIHFSIDDFGTGYSSLSYLKRFPLHTLKIDRSFVKEITTDPDDAAIAQAIIAMAHSLKMTVIAEAVETKEQLNVLRGLACDQIQGYYFSPPVPTDEASRLLLGSPFLP